MKWYLNTENGTVEYRGQGNESEAYTEVSIYLQAENYPLEKEEVEITKEGCFFDIDSISEESFLNDIPRIELEKIVSKNANCYDYLFDPNTKTLKPF